MSTPNGSTIFQHLRDFNVIVTFYPIGSAPRLKVSKFTIHGSLSVGELTAYVNKMLKISPDADSTKRGHLYFNQSIELMNTQIVGDFVKVFGKPAVPGEKDASINIHYSIGKAYL